MLKERVDKEAISAFMSTASQANAEHIGTAEYKGLRQEIIRWVQSIETHRAVPAITTGPPPTLTDGDIDEGS